MKKLGLTLCLGLLNICLCFGQGINFETQLSWAQIKEKAKKENKPIFLDIYTTWCAPCHMMDRDVLSKSEVGDFFNGRFISVKVQVDQTEKDIDYIKSWYADATEINSQFVKSYPTYVFLSPNAEPSYKINGMRSVEDFLTESKAALDPGKQLNLMLEKFKEGKRDGDFVLELARKARDLGMLKEARSVSQTYIEKLKPAMLIKPANAWLVYEFTDSVSDKGFNLMLNNKATFTKADKALEQVYIDHKLKGIIRDGVIWPVYEKKKVTNKDGKEMIATIITRKSLPKLQQDLKKYGTFGNELFKAQRTLVSAIEIGDAKVFENKILPFLDTNSSWDAVKQKIAEQQVGDGEERLIGNTIVYYLNKSSTDKERFLPLIVASQNYYNERFPYLMGGFLNDRAWIIFEITENREYLLAAQDWAKKAVELDPGNAGFIDTYANLTYKLGDNTKAIQLYKKVIEHSPYEEVFQKTFKRMTAGERTWPEMKDGQLVLPN